MKSISNVISHTVDSIEHVAICNHPREREREKKNKNKDALFCRLSLKKRLFIGNTSMDPQLSLLMANLSQVRNDHLVLDPFVGTGSILLACAQFGAQVLGSDIDYLMVHARTKPSRKGQKKRKGESFKGNFQQYQLESKLIDVIVGDASNDPWSSNIVFDAIGM